MKLLYRILGLMIIILASAYVGWQLAPPKIVEVNRVIAQPIYIEKVIVETIGKEIPQYIYETVERVIVVRPEMTGEERIRATAFINYGIMSHEFYATETSLQTPMTGDTSYNLGKVADYKFIKELLERAYGGKDE